VSAPRATTGRRLRRAVLHPLILALPIVAGAAVMAALAAFGSGVEQTAAGTVMALVAFGWAGLNAGYANSGST
jgi:hypothetical protein